MSTAYLPPNSDIDVDEGAFGVEITSKIMCATQRHDPSVAQYVSYALNYK